MVAQSKSLPASSRSQHAELRHSVLTAVTVLPDTFHLDSCFNAFGDSRNPGSLSQACEKRKETAERLMIGCLVHYSMSYQRVAERVSSSLSLAIRNISKNTFCKIAWKIPSLESKSEVMKVFGVLRGEISLPAAESSVAQNSEEAFVHEEYF